MSVILNFNLSYQVALGIPKIICLFDPSPPFQYEQNSNFTYSVISDANLYRDNTVALAGFEATDIANPNVKPNILPANTFAVNNPSNVYNTPTSNDTYSVIQINATTAQIEPGYSRLSITYTYYDSVTTFYNEITEYFDCPFYEGFNVTARELNNIKDYIEESQSFLQKELDITSSQTSYALSHNFWRGTSVSGQVSTTPSTIGLVSGPIVGGSGPVGPLVTSPTFLNFYNTIPQNIQIADPGYGGEFSITESIPGIVTIGLQGSVLTVTPNSIGPSNLQTTLTILDTAGNATSVIVTIFAGSGTLTSNPSYLNFSSPSAPYQIVQLSQTNNTSNYTVSQTVTGIVNVIITNVNNTGGTLRITPVNNNGTAYGTTVVNVTDGTHTVSINVNVNPPLYGPLQLSSNLLNFFSTTPQTINVTETGYTDSYTITASNPGIITTSYSPGVITVTPVALNQETQYTVVSVEDSQSHVVVFEVYIYPQVGTLSISPQSLVFADPAAPNQTVNILETNHNEVTNPYTYTMTVTGIVEINVITVGSTGATLSITPVDYFETIYGTTILTVSDGIQYVSMPITVNPPVIGPMTLSVSNLSFVLNNQPLQKTFQVYDPLNVVPYTITASNSGIVTVTNTGSAFGPFPSNTFTVTSVGLGTTTLTISDGSRSQTLPITVNAAVGPLNVTPEIINFASPSAPTQTAAITDPNNVAAYTVITDSGGAQNLVSTTISGSSLILTPTNSGYGTQYLTVSDGTQLASIIVNVTNPLSLSANSLTFNSNAAQSIAIYDTISGATFSLLNTSVTNVVTTNITGSTLVVTPVNQNSSIQQTILTIGDNYNNKIDITIFINPIITISATPTSLTFAGTTAPSQTVTFTDPTGTSTTGFYCTTEGGIPPVYTAVLNPVIAPYTSGTAIVSPQSVGNAYFYIVNPVSETQVVIPVTVNASLIHSVEGDISADLLSKTYSISEINVNGSSTTPSCASEYLAYGYDTTGGGNGASTTYSLNVTQVSTANPLNFSINLSYTGRTFSDVYCNYVVKDGSGVVQLSGITGNLATSLAHTFTSGVVGTWTLILNGKSIPIWPGTSYTDTPVVHWTGTMSGYVGSGTVSPGPLTILPSSLSFTSTNSPSQIATISDPNFTGAYQVTRVTPSNVCGVYITGSQITVVPGTSGTALISITDGLNVANLSVTVNSVVQTVGPLTVSPNSIQFTGPNAASQNVVISDPNNVVPYKIITDENPGVVSSSILNNILTVKPVGIGTTYLIISDGTNTVGISPIIVYAPLSVSTNSLNFAGPNAPVQTIQIIDPDFNVFSITNVSQLGIASINISGTTITVTPLNYGSFTFTISDGVNSAIISVSVNTPAAPTIIALSSNSSYINQTIIVSGNNFNSVRDTAYVNQVPAQLTVNSLTIATVIIPPTTAGPTTLTITDGLNPASVPFTILGQPNLTNVSPNQSAPGELVTLTGTNFGVQDASSIVFINGLSCLIENWTNTNVSVIVPATSLGLTQIYLQNAGGATANLPFTILNSDVVIVTPSTAVVALGTSYNFTAAFYLNGQGSGTSITTNANTVWQVNNTTNGDGTHGTITQSGVYTAPSNAPSSGSQIQVSASYLDANIQNYIKSIAIVNLSPTPQVTLTPSVITVVAGQKIGFTTTFTVGTSSIFITNTANYYVNNVPGGSFIDGIITSEGLYSAPANFSVDTTVTISASYMYQSIIYYGNVSVTVKAASGNFSNILVSSQLNIYLGDGRSGYVPAGTQISAYPGQYVFVQFVENLNGQTLLPNPNYYPIQQLSIKAKSAIASDIANTIYNLADGVVNSDGTISTLRTVVLGIVDPSDGVFHTMWDIANILPSSNTGAFSLSSNEPMKNITTSNDIAKYIDELPNNAQNQINSLNVRSNIILAGNCSYDNNQFTIIDNIYIVGTSSDNKNYGILGIIPKQKIELKENQYLFINNEKTLKVGNFSDVFLGKNDTDTIIVGTVLDRFYTNWPLLKTISINLDNVNNLNEVSYVEVGSLKYQWGVSDIISVNKKSMITNNVKFPKAYEKSCVVHTTPQESSGGFPNTEADNITLTEFDVKIINTGSTSLTSKISWFSIGV